jgi:hypothetical protein
MNGDYIRGLIFARRGTMTGVESIFTERHRECWESPGQRRGRRPVQSPLSPFSS